MGIEIERFCKSKIYNGNIIIPDDVKEISDFSLNDILFPYINIKNINVSKRINIMY